MKLAEDYQGHEESGILTGAGEALSSGLVPLEVPRWSHLKEKLFFALVSRQRPGPGVEPSPSPESPEESGGLPGARS